MFRDRHEAGLCLAAKLTGRFGARPLILALPRGGLPVAAPVAEALDADLDVLVVRKVGAPSNPEYAMGAVGEGGVVVIDRAVCSGLHVSEDEVRRATLQAQTEVARRVRAYRSGLSPLTLTDRDVVVVDDGLATGSTAAAAVNVARRMGARSITLAVPVGSREAVARLRGMVDDLVCLEQPEPFWAVGEHFEDFDQLDDAEVVRILAEHPQRVRLPKRDAMDRDVRIDVGGAYLPGHLAVPPNATGMVVFVHGTGSTRNSPRNLAVASMLRAAGLGTLLFDLVTEGESQRGLDPGIGVSADRVVAAANWLARQPETATLPMGYLGSSSGAAVALAAAAAAPHLVEAVVSRSGRPDLAREWLSGVQAPTLLIVGSLDQAVVDINRQAQQELRCPHLLEVVRGATHLFEEEGTLTQAAALARTWFLQHLGPQAGMGAQPRAS
jgi:putative phosphoribosyl transferase